MKYRIWIILTIITLLMTSACGILDDLSHLVNSKSNDGGSGDSDIAKSNMDQETLPQVNEEDKQVVIEGNRDFAGDLYAQVANADGNIIFSPISLSLALSMTLAGAEGSTKEAMLKTLHYNLDANALHPVLNALVLDIKASEENVMEDMEGNPFQLNIANSIWGQAGLDFKSAFLDTLAKNYGAGIYRVDYKSAPDEARKTINEWVSEETEEKIPNLIPPGAIDGLTRLVLANAIYFNGSWYTPFKPSMTSKETFYQLDGSESQVEMMKLYGEGMPYFRGDDYQAVQLNYLSRDFVMNIIVPDQGAFADVENALSDTILNEILYQLSYQDVDLEMPKYDFEARFNATQVLQNLGMAEAFDPDEADFSGMTDEEKLYITSVIHKATITVDEQGTEAAAATAVIMGVESAAPSEDEPIKLVIDRPFIFTIEHQPTGTILFIGRVTQP